MLFQKKMILVMSLAIIVLGGCTQGLKEPQKPLRLDEPRIAPLAESEWDKKQNELLTPLKGNDGKILNVLTTLGRHPDLLEQYIPFVLYILERQTLPAREREMLILRIGWLNQAKYEFGQHTLAAKQAGLTDDEIVRITKGPEDPGWTEFDAALICAADELYRDAIISDATWKILSKRYDERQMIDVVFTIGQYNMVCWALNSFGVQLEDGVPGFPKGTK